ncbi:hypothetical protein AALA22_01115 [Anaerovoracaceae bacterium 41-7]|uniref:hypothetical protein n=1 Tax=Emergencia sp. 1XD21-10 TaxID=2304569 RepID=UPI001379B073|nr:hypothetical protein [Emergencia sp. 1XD21-10]NCF00103.1 hypothetical protein [Emergencia sp. 1XD21-10]
MDGYIRVKAGKEFWDILNLIFTDEFMQKHTNFENFEYFRYSSAVMCSWSGEYMIYPETVFNNFVIESTVFKTWDEMVMKAADEKFEKKIS